MVKANRSTGDSENADIFPLSERLKLMGDGLVNNLTLLISGVLGIVLVPLMLKWLGPKSYGVWIVAMATAGMLGAADLGLYSTVVYEVSSNFGDAPDREASLFVEGAGNAYLLLGLIGALILGIVGYFVSDHLQIGLRLQGTAQIVFWLIGLGFLIDQLNLFGGAVLVGVRRFDYVNYIRSGAAVLRAAGIVALLALGGSLISIAIWQAIAAVLGVVLTFAVVRNLVPQFRFRLTRLHWKQLRQKSSFAISSSLTTIFGGFVWQVGSLVIGFMQGSAAVVPFYIGEKFPYATANAGWQAAEALFPAAGQNQKDLSRTREILKVGARWVLVLMLPTAILLWFAGPSLLNLWLGKIDPETLGVLHVLSLAALADSFMAASLNVLWGRAAMSKIVFPLLGIGMATIGLTVLLLPRMGVTGAAWAALLPTALGSGVLFYLACRECQANMMRMGISISRGLIVPIAGCAIVAYVVSGWAGMGPWALAGTCLSGLIIYLSLLCAVPGQNQERQFLQSAFRRVTSLL